MSPLDRNHEAAVGSSPRVARSARPVAFAALRPEMNPSRYQLPQAVSADRRRAREVVLGLERESKFAFAGDPLEAVPTGKEMPSHLREVAALPGQLAKLPDESDFSVSYKANLLSWKLAMKLSKYWALARRAVAGNRPEARYAALFGLVDAPVGVLARWRDDAEFARQRLNSIEPMTLCRWGHAAIDPPKALVEAVDRVLADRGSRLRFHDLASEQRLFVAAYPELWHPAVQQHVRCIDKQTTLAAPTCVFWTDDTGLLMPLAIQLKPPWIRDGNPVFTPLDAPYVWLMAKTHAQCASGHIHEGYRHLLETHLVSEAVAVSMLRRLHHEHPIRALLEPHYVSNLAIDAQARNHLLAPDGPIQKAMGAGVKGTLNAARVAYSTWRFDERSFPADLARRGFDVRSPTPFASDDVQSTGSRFYYLEDGAKIWAAIQQYVRAIVRLWYPTPIQVMRDGELAAFLDEVGDPGAGNVRGFPRRVETPDELTQVLTNLIFRAGPQHAAVNNGQFDTYGWIPNSPGTFLYPLPDETPGDADAEARFWRAMPGTGVALQQLAMVWVLSKPTQSTLLYSGSSPAFSAELCPPAAEAVAGFRRRLDAISEEIVARNEGLAAPYTYLDPLTIARSTEI